MDKLHIITVAFAVLAIILSTVAMIKQNSKKERYAEQKPTQPKIGTGGIVVLVIVAIVFLVMIVLAAKNPSSSAISFPAFSF